MKATRRYQVLPDRGVCLHPGCPWHRDGDSAEPLGEAHAAATGHEVHVQTGARVIFGSSRQVKAGARA